MEVGRYWKRFKACKSYKDKCSLQREVLEVDNTLRKLFTQQRDSWVVPELENPYETLIPVFDHFDLFKCLVELPEEAAIPKVCREYLWGSMMAAWNPHYDLHKSSSKNGVSNPWLHFPTDIDGAAEIDIGMKA